MTNLATLLADPEQPIAIIVELTYRDPDADATSTVRITTANWEGGEAGYLEGLLADPGDRGLTVEADELGRIATRSLGPMRFLNGPRAPGGARPLDWLRTMVFGKRAVTLLAGAPNEPIANYEEIGSGLADGEPEFDDDSGVMTLRVATALGRLGQDLDIKRYVGEPAALRGLTTTAAAQASYDAAHDLESFTLAARGWVDSHAGTGVTFRLVTKVSGSLINYNMQFTGGTNIVNAAWSHGGGTAAILASGAVSTGRWITIVFALRSGHQYLMVDGEIVDEGTLTQAPDMPAVGIKLHDVFSGRGRQLDARILDHYIPPDEARAWMATRASGDEDGLVGLYRGESSGSTLTDYSPTGADATIAGTEGVDFEHVSSDLGGEDLAGTSMPAGIGEWFNGPADLVSAAFERWRWLDRDPVDPGGAYDPTPVVRSEGELLTETTDWTDEGQGVVALVSESPLVTVGSTDAWGSTSHYWAFPDQVLTRLLTTYVGLSTGEFDTDALARLGMMYPYRSGMTFRRSPASEVVEKYMAGLAGYVTRGRNGVIRLDCLRPPVSPGPRSGPCLEFMAEPDTAVNFGDVGNISSGSSWTVAAWIRTQRLAPNMTVESVGDTTVQEVILDKTSFGAAAGGDFGFGTSGYAARGLVAWTASSGAASVRTLNAPVLLRSPAGGWQFVAAVSDAVADEVRFYHAPSPGGTVALVGTVASHLSPAGFPQGSAPDTVIGTAHNLGSTAEVSAWGAALSLAELQDLCDASPAGGETNLLFYAPLDDGEGSPRELVSGGTGTVTGCRWRPDLTVDLARVPRPFRRRGLVPAKSITVGYRSNTRTLGPSEWVASLSRAEQRDIEAPGREIPWTSSDVAEDDLAARDVRVDTPFHDIDGARAVLRHLIYRYSADREAAILGPSPDLQRIPALRQAMLLEPGDEVRVLGYQELQEPGLTYRVTGLKSLSDLDAEVVLWR